LGCVSPLDESRGGTPEDVRTPNGVRAAARKAAVITEQRLTAFRFLLFLRSPDGAKRNPGSAYELLDRSRISLRFIRATGPTVTNPETTTGFI
jgi:hypothetical protein